MQSKNMFAAERTRTTPKTIFSIFKRGINGIYHHISHEHIRFTWPKLIFAIMSAAAVA